MAAMRVGLGFDSHALVEGRALILGGVRLSMIEVCLAIRTVMPSPTH